MFSLKRIALGIALAISCAVGAVAQYAGPFNPSAQNSFNVGTTSSNIAIGSGASEIVVVNTGPQTAFLQFGSASIAATTGAGMPVGPGCSVALAPYGAPYMAAITQAGSTSLLFDTGYGTITLPPSGCSAQSMNTLYASNATTHPISISTATTTKLLAGVTGEKTYVLFIGWQAAGTDNVTLEYGTTTTNPCDTGTTAISGAMDSVANNNVMQAGGGYPVIIVPAGDDFCAVTSGAVGLGGYFTAAQL